MNAYNPPVDEVEVMIETEVQPEIRLNPNDNIIIARCDIPAGTAIRREGVVSQSDIPLGHKIAARPIAQGSPIFKYGTIIGYASEDILPGAHVHLHNVRFDDVRKDYAMCRDYKAVKELPQDERRVFMGYRRGDGQVGTRNLIAVPVMSNCAATVARRIAEYFTPQRLERFPNVDGVVPLITTQGCGMDGGGISMEYLRRVIAGHMRNPNFAGAVVCALGCERNNIDGFFESQGFDESPTLCKLVIQDCGAASAVRRGIAIVEEMLPLVNTFRRAPVSVEHLKIALQCGGSDTFSSFSSNPALGLAIDELVLNGGTAVLSETTEIYGAEETLTSRARTPEVAQKLLDAISWWKDYCKGCEVQINGGVAPGNNDGGLTNILEKSLGSVKKGGSGPLNEVYEYAQPIKARGLVVMDTPSYDPVSATSQFAGGCNLCVFTTGRGSCFGARHFPTIKVASNTSLYQRMNDDMDLNAGAVVDGEKSLPEMGREIFEKIISVASGEKTKSELFGMGDDEYIPWSVGITG